MDLFFSLLWKLPIAHGCQRVLPLRFSDLPPFSFRTVPILRCFVLLKLRSLNDAMENSAVRIFPAHQLDHHDSLIQLPRFGDNRQRKATNFSGKKGDMDTASRESASAHLC